MLDTNAVVRVPAGGYTENVTVPVGCAPGRATNPSAVVYGIGAFETTERSTSSAWDPAGVVFCVVELTTRAVLFMNLAVPCVSLVQPWVVPSSKV